MLLRGFANIPKWFLYVSSHLGSLPLKTEAAENFPLLLLMLHLGEQPRDEVGTSSTLFTNYKNVAWSPEDNQGGKSS